MPQKNAGDGTGTDSSRVPEGQGDRYFENAKPENPAGPYDSSRGGKGTELPPNSHRTTPLK
jgi:hypothetical protein